ncbi:unnamed protein product, partial [Protopolystoma xenopodis]
MCLSEPTNQPLASIPSSHEPKPRKTLFNAPRQAQNTATLVTPDSEILAFLSTFQLSRIPSLCGIGTTKESNCVRENNLKLKCTDEQGTRELQHIAQAKDISNVDFSMTEYTKLFPNSEKSISGATNSKNLSDPKVSLSRSFDASSNIFDRSLAEKTIHKTTQTLEFNSESLLHSSKIWSDKLKNNDTVNISEYEVKVENPIVIGKHFPDKNAPPASQTQTVERGESS